MALLKSIKLDELPKSINKYKAGTTKKFIYLLCI